MGKSKPATQVTQQVQQQQATPWAPATGAFEDLVTQAQNAYKATPKTPTFTGANADQIAAMNQVRTLAPSLGVGGVDLQNLAQAQIRGDYLSPDSNPFLKGAIDAAINPIKDGLNGRILTAGDAATMSGAYGGDRHTLLKSEAMKNFDREALDATSRITYQNYANERQIQQNSGALLNQAGQIMMAPSQALMNVGNQQMQYDQAAALAALDAPWAGLDRYTDVLGTLMPLSAQNSNGTTTTTGTPAKASGVAGGLAGALGGASAGGAFGPWGAGVGAVLGGLGGLFG